MAGESPEELSRAVLGYVEDMLVELAGMTEGAGLSGLAARIRVIATEVGLEAADLMFSPPNPRAGGPPDRQG